MPAVVKENLLENINDISLYRSVFHIYNNIYDRQLHIDQVNKGAVKRITIGDTDGHARWFDWNVEKTDIVRHT